MSHIQSFFASLMDNFMHPRKPVAIFPMASDTYLMAEKKPKSVVEDDEDATDNNEESELQRDKREYYID